MVSITRKNIKNGEILIKLDEILEKIQETTLNGNHKINKISQILSGHQKNQE